MLHRHGQRNFENGGSDTHNIMQHSHNYKHIKRQGGIRISGTPMNPPILRHTTIMQLQKKTETSCHKLERLYYIHILFYHLAKNLQK